MIDCCHHRMIYWMAGISCLMSGCGSNAPTPQKSVESEVVIRETVPVETTSAKQAQKSAAKQEASTTEPVAETPPTHKAETAKVSVAKTPKMIYRPSDQRPVHNKQRLELLGIHCYESPRLKLYTDIDPEIAKKLPAVVDQAYLALVDYFGPLPTNREGTEFQVTGYIMQNRELFKKAGVILDSLPKIVNGRHLKAQFWMDSQSEEYYLRHLMLHEYTHCYSMIMENIGAPVWYLEGIAESMATHSIGNDGKIQFNVMPYNKKDFGGLGRISLIQEAVLSEPPKSMLEVMQFTPNDFVGNNTAYAWSWALCQFFDKHPAYAKSFRELSRQMQGTEFSSAVARMVDDDDFELNAAWLVFAKNLQPGYDFYNATMTIVPGLTLAPGKSLDVTVQSNRGWQSSEVEVEQGKTYEVTAEGMFSLAQQPKPWMSTADGISFRYFKGQPLGRLIMLIKPAKDAADLSPLLQEYPLGANATWMAPVTGTVYFRLNDAWDELADNSGQVTVKVTRKQDSTVSTVPEN
ncbi:hypothetical protein Pan241w_45240 [Gimesia alba]|uniref:DUF1570 domain-containing protein n=1 Tax=Gimesia alba TaxID=2527973 RepID=A0A517RKK7_9PLAN|nr:hypothetical protein [Gimesia alba]QDT44415.1 hypothetical protein Pan241w_45240 [Gimesia alba]